MKFSELKSKNVDELKRCLLDLLQEQFNLRMQNTNETRPHLFRQVRRDIARIKTLLSQEKCIDRES